MVKDIFYNSMVIRKCFTVLGLVLGGGLLETVSFPNICLVRLNGFFFFFLVCSRFRSFCAYVNVDNYRGVIEKGISIIHVPSIMLKDLMFLSVIFKSSIILQTQSALLIRGSIASVLIHDWFYQSFSFRVNLVDILEMEDC